jgi:deazaflavin-dependent oxidoreductase (nitroreductase family)
MVDDEKGFREALNSAEELSITFVGRKTGKKYTIPVWFVYDPGTMALLPVKGSKSTWYRSILKNPKMELRASGKRATAKARQVRDRKRIDEIMEKFRAKYGASDVKRYYPDQDVAVELSI